MFQKTNYYDTKIYKQFTKAYKELQKKYERFEEGDQTRIDEIWRMNDAEAKAMVEKIMRADQVIHEQQLSITWERPTDAIFNFAKPKGAGAANDGASNNQANSGTQGNSLI